MIYWFKCIGHRKFKTAYHSGSIQPLFTVICWIYSDNSKEHMEQKNVNVAFGEWVYCTLQKCSRRQDKDAVVVKKRLSHFALGWWERYLKGKAHPVKELQGYLSREPREMFYHAGTQRWWQLYIKLHIKLASEIGIIHIVMFTNMQNVRVKE